MVQEDAQFARKERERANLDPDKCQAFLGSTQCDFPPHNGPHQINGTKWLGGRLDGGMLRQYGGGVPLGHRFK